MRVRKEGSRPGPRPTEMSLNRFDVVHVGAALLYNLREDDAFWSSGCDPRKLPDLRGALVKVVAPSTVSDEALQVVVTLLGEKGAEKVSVVHRAAQVAHVPARDSQPAAHRSVRVVVEAMVEEARTADRDALRAEVESVLAASRL